MQLSISSSPSISKSLLEVIFVNFGLVVTTKLPVTFVNSGKEIEVNSEFDNDTPEESFPLPPITISPVTLARSGALKELKVL